MDITEQYQGDAINVEALMYYLSSYRKYQSGYYFPRAYRHCPQEILKSYRK